MFVRVAIGIAALAVFCGDVWVLTNRDRTTTVAVDDIVAQYRRSATSTTSVTSAPASAPVATTVTSVATTARPHGPAAAATKTPSAPAIGTTVAAAPAFGRPKDGVYAYDTTGGETISLGGSRHDYPAVTYATVQRRGGCEWLLEQPVVKEHVDKRTFCASADVLNFLAQTTAVSFFGQTASDTTKCDPPQLVLRHRAPTGSTGEYSCRSATNESRARVTRLAPTRIEVAGRSVDVEHVLIEGEIHGDAEGTSRGEQWWIPSLGLLVRETRTVFSRAHQFGADIEYREKATFHLRSLEPRT